MTNFTKLGEPTSIYADIVYTPTEVSQPESPGAQKEVSGLDWSRDILKKKKVTTPEVNDNEDTDEDTNPIITTYEQWVEANSKEPDVVPDNHVEINPKMKYNTPTGRTYSSASEFKNDIYNTYLKILKEKNIDPEFAYYLTAQDALESGWGKSGLSKYNNFGGIKASADSDYAEFKTKEWDKSKNDYKEILAKFRVFKNLDDYCRYKIDLLSNSNYRTFTRKPEEFADSLTTYAVRKYATDPNYKEKINRMYKSVKSK